ncbi:CD9 antigen-like [Anarrhichthys ocellatus]|uniref:CD9 antigen-like n=1 Tax=Anarrhichthys ocellatus TaxID=433405 RepID=UPI0012ED919F|nr:CD9 antigen-like [Anarrhichthys ocellatus]
MALDGSGLIYKYTLFIFNLIFALVGFAFLGIGLWLRFSNGTRGIFQIEALNSSVFVMAVTVLIALGSVMLIVVAFGYYGACNEKTSALQVFSFLLFILALAEVAVGVIGYSNKDEVGRKIVEFYSSMYALYVTGGGTDQVFGVILTFIHNQVSKNFYFLPSLHCCGLTGVPLVELVKHTCPEPDGFLEHFKMDSCPEAILSVFESKAELVMGIFVGTGALLVIALICSIILNRKLRLSESPAQCIILTQSTSVLANPIPQHGFVATSYAYPVVSTSYPNPVISTSYPVVSTSYPNPVVSTSYPVVSTPYPIVSTPYPDVSTP